MIFVTGFLNAEVNGQLSQIDGKYILHVWGTHYERGYALGYLMGNNVMDVFSNYFFSTVTGSNAYYYNNRLQYFIEHFEVPERYISEAEGIINGMQDAGIATYHNGLARNLGLDDILFVNGIVDMSSLSRDELGCSSLSSWGEATINDPMLQGNISITRLMDWSRNQSLIANPLLVIHHPSEPNERRWMSFTYPGLFGALSAVTDNRAAAFLNMGNIHPSSNQVALTPVLLDIRSGLELLDYNNDGVHNTEDVFASVADGNHVSGTIIHSTQQWQDSCRAAIIETNNNGTVRRMQNENSNIAGDNLAATNHFRLLSAPVYCSRYSRIVDSLAVSPLVSETRQWTLMQGAGGVSTNMMMIQYMPNMNKVLWSVASSTLAAYTQTPLELDTSELFNLSVTNHDESLSPATSTLSFYPNPLHKGQNLTFKHDLNIISLEVYNLRGQLVYRFSNPSTAILNLSGNIFSNQASGIYFIKATDRNGRNMQSKLLYLK
jgi:hypothetical protein